MASEFDLIYRHLASFGAGPSVILGVGDDAASLRVRDGHELLVSTDTLVEGRHFPVDSLPEHIAYRAVATAVSDLAAMAATPIAMTLALTLPEADDLWMHGFSMGLASAVSDFGIPLVGGDLTRGPLCVSVTVMGECPAGLSVKRSGARVGDMLCVTGTLGDAAAGLLLIQGTSDLSALPDIDTTEYLEHRFYRPTPALMWCDWLRTHATSAIDVSDGLLADVTHIAHASGVGVQISAHALPLSEALASLKALDPIALALHGGDDYELAFTVPAGTELPAGLQCIGTVVDGDHVICTDIATTGVSGYDHFR